MRSHPLSPSPSLFLCLCLCLCLCLYPSCDVDERALDSGSPGSGGTGTAGAGNGGTGNSSAQGGSTSTNGGSTNASMGGTSSDAGTTPRDCGALGEACCTDAPTCGDGLGCDVGSERCVRCATFEGVGILQGFSASYVQDISADGRWVVGYMLGALGNMAFRRERGSATEAEPLGLLPGGTSSEASAVSGDGFAIVGTANTAAGDRGFRWTAGNMVDLGLWNANDTASRAADVSADGNVVALTGTDINGNEQAFLWSNANGKTIINTLQEVRGISADGNVVVGNGDAVGNQAVITTPGGLEPMGPLNGDSVAFAFGISSDGSTGFGSSGAAGMRGFFYRNGTIGEALGITRVLAASGDGLVLGGQTNATTCSGGRAGVWTSAQGAQAVACDVLPAGIIPNGWALTFVTAISDDGRVIAGEGVNPMSIEEGWVAVVGPDCRNL